MDKKYPLEEGLFNTYDKGWYELISLAKQTGYSKAEVRTVLQDLRDTHHLKSEYE